VIFNTGSLYISHVNNILLSLATPDAKLNYKKIGSFKTGIDVSSKNTVDQFFNQRTTITSIVVLGAI
jgi:hypothetical protein